MPRYIITQQPLESQLPQQRSRPKKKNSAVENSAFIQRLRQVLQNNRKAQNNQHHQNTNQYLDSNYNNDYQNNNTKKIGHSRYVSHVVNPSSNRYDNQKQDNQQQVIYIVEKRQKRRQTQNQGKTVKLPKLKKKTKVLKTMKYDNIDNDEKQIIKNYMNAKLIQFKNPPKKSPKRPKKRAHTLDSVGQLPQYSNKKYYKIQTPIQNLSRYVLSQQNKKIQRNPKQFSTRTQFAGESRYQNQKFYIVPHKTQQGKTRKSVLNDYVDDTMSHKIEPIQYVIPSKNHKQTWQLVDPLNLQTYFIKLRKIGNSSSIQNTKMQRTKFKIPEIPSRQQMSNFIKNYIPENEEIKIQQLIKSDTFQIIKDQTDQYKSFYFGETRDDKRYGQGILITDKIVFQGVWVDDMKLKGVQISELGKYKGDFKDDVRSGKGQFFWAHGQYYSGEWKNGKKNGSGYWKSLKQQSYMGQWKNGQVTGYGVHTMKNGQKYEGQFVNFLKHGFGKQIFPNKDFYEGRYVQGQPHGKGRYEWKNGTVYQGEFVEGYRQGKGIIIAPNRLKFQGTFKNEVIEGIGRLQSSNGDIFNGMFSNNKKNGHGIFDMKSQHRIIKGIWANNQLVQQQ